MVQMKFFFVFMAVMTIFVLAANMADATDCPSGKFSGPCFAWDGEQCRRLCKEEGRVSGHCSAGLMCWCEEC
ncbi:drosomycin-like [Drosophila eugracilis]|uniref:drosomycin-like n=1 Tax=Drosophila eugracilis TaxID=29029 RepID=UPI0007E7E524|nr:drosomycin-like [Drosophila eugracilis]